MDAPPQRSARTLTRVALVGAGYIAEFHLEILANTPGVAVLAVCDADPVRAQTAARKHQVPHAVTSMAELPGLGVDVIHLTVPPNLHVQLAREALELGLGVFLEKPMALCSADASALVQLARDRDLALAVNHNNVFHPAFARLVQRLEAGEIGKLEHVRVSLSVPLRQLDAGDYTHWMFQAPAHIILEQATHPLSQVQRLIGGVRSAHTTLLGTRELNPGQPFHDRWLVAAEGERGTAEIYLAFGQPFTRCSLEVLGSDGCLEADLGSNTLVGESKSQSLDFWNVCLAGLRRSTATLRDSLRGLWGWSAFTLGIGPRRDSFFVGMRDSILDFYSNLHANSAASGSGQQAIEVAQWCDALAEGVSRDPAPSPQLPAPGPARKGEVVLTGATGFIGRRTVERLLADDVPVTIITRRLHSLPPEIVDPALTGKLRVFKATLSDAQAMTAALKDAHCCLHLATGGGDTWEQVERDMVQSSRQLAEWAAAAKVKRFVYVSSVAALYTGPDSPVREIEDGYPTDPKPAARPVYARGKIASEKSLKEFAERSPLELVIVRPGVVLGRGTPMQHSGLGLWVRDNHCVGWGAGTHGLPIVWVNDVADALARAAQHQGSELSGQTLNLCTRTPLSASAMVEALRASTGRDLHFHPRPLALSQLMEVGKWIVKQIGGRRAPFPSYRDLKARGLYPPFRCEMAREVLGWKPVEDSEALLEHTVNVYATPED